MPTITATPTSGTGKRTITVSSSLSYQRNDVTKTLRVNTNSGETATCTVVKKGVGLVPDGDFSRAIQDITADETTINVMASDFGSGALCNSQTLYCKVLSPVVAQLSALTVEIRIIQEGGVHNQRRSRTGKVSRLRRTSARQRIGITSNLRSLSRPILLSQ